MTIEFPKLSSLSAEILKFSFFSFIFLGVIISSLMVIFGRMHPVYAGFIGFGVSLIWVIIMILWTKGKIEELFSKLVYVIDTLEEEKGKKAVIPIPIHEEIIGIIESIKRIVENFEERYEKNIKELEAQLEAISENTAKILRALEKMDEGHIRVEFPYGLDPVGAIGQALQQVVSKYVAKLTAIKLSLQECENIINSLALLLEEEGDKIDKNRIRESILKLKEVEEKLKTELEFFKDV